MSDQNIGVRAQFLTPGFARGLARYLTGLNQAIAATNATVAAINNLGAQSAAVFSTLGSNARTTANALRSVANAAQAANRALNATGRRRAAAPAGAQQTGGLNAALAASTARANQQATQQINAAAGATRRLGAQARTTTTSVSGLNAKTIALGTAMGTVAAAAIGNLTTAFVGFGSKVLEIVTFFERLELSIAFFTARSFQAENATLSFDAALALGEKEAQGLAIWLQRLAVASPFTTRTVGTIFRTAQAYGLTRKEAEQLTPLLLDFGAAAGLNEDILERLALAMGQVRSRGKLTGEEVRQLGNSGLPVRDILVKALGIANSEFDELLESGALTSDVVIPHLIVALKNFEGAGERVAFGTIGGIVSAMEELREISTAKFFTGFLEPLKQSFQDLFKVLNKPEVLAFITVLGQELGGNFKDAVFGTIDAIKSYIRAFQELDPAIKQQIIVFAAATVGVIALAGAFGLLTLAMGVIANPLVLIATTIGFLISEWTSGFAVLRTVTSRVARSIGNALQGIVRSFGAVVIGFSDFVADISQGFFTVEGQIARFGFNIGASLAEGISASSGVLASALQGIGQLLSFWLAPGSPPRIAPEIDVWGKKTMLEWGKGLGQADVAKFIGPVGKNAINSLRDLGPSFREQGGKTMLEYGKGIADADFIGPLEEGARRAVKVLADSEVTGAAEDAGFRVSESYINGFLSRIPQMTPRISEELQKVLDQIGRGAQLTRGGALSFSRFLGGFKEADFGILNDITDTVQSFLQNLVDTGEIQDIDLPRLLFGARQDLAQGIQDIQRVGAVTESTMQRIKLTAGGASGFVLKLLSSYAPLRAATLGVEAAQKTLNDLTEKYKAIIAPLRKELEAINEANRLADDEEKILSLRRLIANEGVSDRRRRNAQLEIDQIIAEQRVRGLEEERDTATESAQDQLDAREKVRDQLDDQFQVLQANIQAQLTQLGLFGQEAAIIKKLREEAEKLREKEMTSEELQLKFLEFQNEEVQDLIAAAKAKHTLEDATSTLLEKEAAQITLAEVALRRRNREAEAIKLGIPVEELIKLRDFVVTLEDIGVKSKEAFAAPDTDAFGDSLVNANKITAEWEATLQKVRDRWDEIKQRVTATATEINNNLPSFLKIFPEFEGGEPPIIGFLTGVTKAVVGLAVVMTTFSVVAKITSLVTALRSLALTGTLAGAGAAAGAGGAAAGAAGLTGVALFVSTLTGALIAFAIAAPAAILAAQAVGAAFGALGFGQEVVNLGDFGQATQDRIDSLISAIVAPDPISTALLEDNIKTSVETAITNGLSNVAVAQSALTAIHDSIAGGLIADTPENRTMAADFRNDLLAILNETRTGDEIKKIDILAGTEIVLPSEDVRTQAKERIAGFLNSLAGEEEAKGFGQSITRLIKTGFTTGLTDAEISNQVMGEFGAGVAAGLVADTPETRQAVQTYISDLLSIMHDAAEVDSPSKLTKREIGLPLGQGIIDGINAAIVLTGHKIIDSTEELFGELKTFLVTRMDEIVVDQTTKWTAIHTVADTEMAAMSTFITTAFGSLLTTLTGRMLLIKNVVVTGFRTMRTDTEAQVRLLRTNVIGAFAGKEGSILDAISLVFLGDENIIPRNIGKDFMEGIMQGIRDNKKDLATTMQSSFSFALGQAASKMQLTPALETRTSGNVVTPSSATTTNINRVNHYHLNVGTNQRSQGVVQDFGIMQTLEGV